jgi:hypothetical protein
MIVLTAALTRRRRGAHSPNVLGLRAVQAGASTRDVGAGHTAKPLSRTGANAHGRRMPPTRCIPSVGTYRAGGLVAQRAECGVPAFVTRWRVGHRLHRASLMAHHALLPSLVRVGHRGRVARQHW